jgi:stress response protein SCP2
MPQLIVKPGEVRKLPVAEGVKFVSGIGYDGDPDLDLMVVRHYGDTGKAEAIFWGKQSWHRPDLGTTSKGLPWIQTPEADVTHTGDARTGAESATGYDETAYIEPTKAPAGVTRYTIIVSNWLNPDERDPQNPPILANATNIQFGIKQEGTANEYVVNLGDTHPFDVTAVLATIDRQDDGSWTLTNVEGGGTTDDLITVGEKLGVDYKE